MPLATFARIDPQKRARLLRAAAREFAANGFHRANVNKIAEAAGVAKGAIYTYFESKEDLYRATLAEGTRILSEVMESVSSSGASVQEQLRELFLRGFDRLRDNGDFLQMYCDLFTAGEPNLAGALAEEIEASSVSFYSSLLERGKRSGEVRGDLPFPLAAFLIDTLYVMFFAASVSTYQRARARAFGLKPGAASGWLKQHVGPLVDFIVRGISPRQATEAGHGKRKAG